MPIDGENKANTKAFRLIKNGNGNRVFKIKDGGNNAQEPQEQQDEHIDEENQ